MAHQIVHVWQEKIVIQEMLLIIRIMKKIGNTLEQEENTWDEKKTFLFILASKRPVKNDQ